MCIEHPPWITDACDYILFLCSLMLVYIMQRVQKDRVCRMDKAWIRRTRRIAYILAAGSSFIDAMNDMSPVSNLLLLICTAFLLIITMVAQNGRLKNGYTFYRNTVPGNSPLTKEIYAMRQKDSVNHR